MTSRSAWADRSPAAQRARAASSARWITGAAARWSAVRWTFRDDSARPSGSRTVGQATTSVGRARSRRHPADDLDLLGVLLAEVGALGADQPEQDRDDRRHPVEVTGSGGALERLGRSRRPRPWCRIPGRRPPRRAVPRRGRPLLGADRDVALLVPRVAPEVVGRIELPRVDEDRHDRRRRLRARPLDERPVAGMQPAHGRHEADRSGSVGQRRPELLPGPQDAGRRPGPLSQRGSQVAVERDPSGRDAAPVGRSRRHCPRTSPRTASSIRTDWSGPGNVPAATSSA